MGDYGVKFVKAGSGDNVLSVSDKDAAFTTKHKILKLFMWGNTTITTDGSGDGSVTITHGLGFAPAFFVFRKGTAYNALMDATSYTNAFWPLGARNIWSDDNVDHALHAYTTSDKLYIVAKGATASKTYTFRYYVLVDLAQDFNGSDLSTLTNSYGTKFSTTGTDVTTAKEYELVYSTKYKALQYYDESFKNQDLTLPAGWASEVDTSVPMGTYVDFTHGLGYQPFYLAFFNGYMVPYMAVNGADAIDYEINGFCDSTRVRISFYKESLYITGNSYGWTESETINIKVYIFTEDLTAT